MENLNIRITYVYHSGFTVETDRCLCVFDFYQGSLKLKDKKIYIFSSHSHSDHYNPEMFQWQEKRPGVQYILSSDICGDASIPPAKDNITFISPDEEKHIDDLRVRAYGSTDEGVSFLAKCDGKNIFHAGDLNWWYWPDDTPEERRLAEKRFKEEIAKIKGEPIDIAFFPVDPRLDHNYCLGAEYFINEINPRYFIPMHFWEKNEAVRQFKNKMKASTTQVIELIQRGQEVIL